MSASASAALGIVLESAALILCPVAVGMAIGAALRHALGRRLSGAVAAAACLVVPTIALTAAVLTFPVIGLWDGVTEGFLCGVGASALLSGGGQAKTIIAQTVNAAVT